MKLSQLRKKYPSAIDKFVYDKDGHYKEWTNEYVDSIYDIDIRYLWKPITDFMDKQKKGGIKIFAHPEGKSWLYVIIGVFRIERGLKNRQQAETKAIEKAFEILEGRSKK
jgi:hypothetical protein